MQLGIFAKTFEGKSPAEVLPQVKAAGFVTAQYNMACSGLPSLPDSIGKEVTDGIRAAMAQSDISLCALSATYNMIHPDTSMREKGLGSLRLLAKAASQLSIPLLTLCTGTRDPHDQWRRHPGNDSPAAWRDLLQSMERVISIAEEFGVDLGVEPELANVVSSAPKAKQLISDMKSPRLRIVLDPANLFEISTKAEQRRTISYAIDLLAGHIVMAHAKDRTSDGAFVATGKGVLDYPHFLGQLRKSGFTGPLVAHGLTAAEAPEVAAFLHHQLERA
jgi:sugar phosphate isomerase/epimerase